MKKLIAALVVMFAMSAGLAAAASFAPAVYTPGMETASFAPAETGTAYRVETVDAMDILENKVETWWDRQEDKVERFFDGIYYKLSQYIDFASWDRLGDEFEAWWDSLFYRVELYWDAAMNKIARMFI